MQTTWFMTLMLGLSPPASSVPQVVAEAITPVEWDAELSAVCDELSTFGSETNVECRKDALPIDTPVILDPKMARIVGSEIARQLGAIIVGEKVDWQLMERKLFRTRNGRTTVNRFSTYTSVFSNRVIVRITLRTNRNVLETHCFRAKW